MAFTFDPVFAVDPNNPANVAKGASITIFDPADVAQSPITIQDPTGSPLPNPMTLDAAGMGPAFQHPTLARVGWKGAGFVGYFTSYEGMLNETIAAKEAAQQAVTEATNAGANAVASASTALAAAVSKAEEAAAAAATSASLVGSPADSAIAAAVSGEGETKDALAVAVRDLGGDAFVAKRVHVIAGLGQSNMKGDNVFTPTAVTDPTHPRIYQFGADSDTLDVATEPLDHFGSVNGLGPLGPIARHYITELPNDDVVVMVPFALGNTGLVNNDANGWRWGVAGNMAEQAVSAIQAAKAAAAAQWPLAKVTLDGVFWVQGEFDGSSGGGISAANYKTDYLALINGMRTALGDTELPWIAGSMLPERLNLGTTAAINTVQATVPYEVARTGFARAQWGHDKGDAIHFGVAGQRVQGARLYAEFKRVLAGLAPVNSASGTPIPPVGVAAPPSPELAVNGATLLKDTFSTASADLVGTFPEVGGSPWEGLTGRFAVVGGKAVAHSGLAITANRIRVPGRGDYTMKLTGLALSSNLNPGKTIRIDMMSDNGSPLNALRAEFVMTTNLTGRIIAIVGGVTTTLAFNSNTIPAGLATAAYNVTVKLAGLTATLSVNDVVMITATLTQAQKDAIAPNRFVTLANQSGWPEFALDGLEVTVAGATA